jgi:hypothetical protein
MDGIGGALKHTFPAKFTLVRINECQVVLHGDGFIRTNLEAFRTSNTGYAAILLGDSTFFFVDATDEYLSVFLILFP